MNLKKIHFVNSPALPGPEQSRENPSSDRTDLVGNIRDVARSAGTSLAYTDPTTLTADQLPGLLDECDRIEESIQRIRERAKELILSGQTVPGWRVSDVRRQSIIDHEGAFTRIWTDYGREVAVRSIKLSLRLAAAAVKDGAGVAAKQAQKDLQTTLSGLIVENVSTRLWRQRE
jgi:hypothetical protein